MATTIPTIILRPYLALPLTEQAIYDAHNDMRKASEMNDFDDGEDEDYLTEDNSHDNMEFGEESITTTATVDSTTLIESTTTSDTKYSAFKSSSPFVRLKSMNLLLLLLLFLLLIQRHI